MNQITLYRKGGRKPLAVLKALFQGQEVTINGNKYRLESNELFCGTYNTHMILAVFIEMCDKISDDEYALICMDITLNDARKARQRDNNF